MAEHDIPAVCPPSSCCYYHYRWCPCWSDGGGEDVYESTRRRLCGCCSVRRRYAPPNPYARARAPASALCPPPMLQQLVIGWTEYAGAEDMVAHQADTTPNHDVDEPGRDVEVLADPSVVPAADPVTAASMAVDADVPTTQRWLAYEQLSATRCALVLPRRLVARPQWSAVPRQPAKHPRHPQPLPALLRPPSPHAAAAAAAAVAVVAAVNGN